MVYYKPHLEFGKVDKLIDLWSVFLESESSFRQPDSTELGNDSPAEGCQKPSETNCTICSTELRIRSPEFALDSAEFRYDSPAHIAQKSSERKCPICSPELTISSPEFGPNSPESGFTSPAHDPKNSSESNQHMSSRKGKNVTVIPKRQPQPRPWSRREGQPFSLPSNLDPKNFKFSSRHDIPGYKERKSLTEWSDLHSIFYNGMLNVAIEPTRTLDVEILREMGIDGSVRQLLQDMDLGTMPYADFDLYPDLVRQFLATCEVQDTDDHITRHLRFFCNGIRHSIFVDDLSAIFQWDRMRRDSKYNNHTLSMMEYFWEAIAYGDFDTVELKIARIANPTLRIVAKVLAHTYFCRQEPDRIHKSALALMFTGLSSELRDLLTFGTPPRLHSIDLSLMFANFLAERKYRALGAPPGPRIDFVGSLITPILTRAQVDLSRATVITQRSFMDKAYLERSRIFRHGIYHWTTARGTASHCTLPRPDWTPVNTLDQLRFAVPGPEQCTVDGRVLPEFDTNPDPLQTIPFDGHDQHCQHGNPFPDPVPLATDFPDEFYDSIPPLPAGASLEYWRGHRDKIQRQQTTILREIVGALTHITWMPIAPCCSEPPGDTDQHQE